MEGRLRGRQKLIMPPSAKKRELPSKHRSLNKLTKRSTDKDANILSEGKQAYSHEERHRCNNHVGHSWYPGACCHDQECHPFPCDDIKADGPRARHSSAVDSYESGSRARLSPRRSRGEEARCSG